MDKLSLVAGSCLTQRSSSALQFAATIKMEECHTLLGTRNLIHAVVSI